MKKTVEQMEQALIDINYFVGGLTDEGIKYHYNKMVNENKIPETKFIGGEWYYWNEELEQWKPETHKFEISCIN